MGRNIRSELIWLTLQRAGQPEVSTQTDLQKVKNGFVCQPEAWKEIVWKIEDKEVSGLTGVGTGREDHWFQLNVLTSTTE